jgi:predicted small lipoprotein YifL
MSPIRRAVREWGRAFGPGLTRVAATLVIAAFALAFAGCGNSYKAPYYLPKNALDPEVDAPLVGTMTKPALQVEGLPVEVKTSGFDVSVTVSGPIVPGEGLPYQPAATTCTWTVTMKDASADVPISIADFHSVDHLGAVFLMGLVPGEQLLPAVLHHGQTITFQLRAYELVGEGMMQWAPDHQHVVAYWDYTVEND